MPMDLSELSSVKGPDGEVRIEALKAWLRMQTANWSDWAVPRSGVKSTSEARQHATEKCAGDQTQCAAPFRQHVGCRLL